MHYTKSAKSVDFPARINFILEAVCAAQATNAALGSFTVTHPCRLRNGSFLAGDETLTVAVPQHDCTTRFLEPKLNGRSLSRNDTPDTVSPS